MSVARVGTDLVISAAGELDPHTCACFEAAIAEAMASSPDRVVVDAAGLEFIDSSGLRALVQAQTALADRRATLVLRAPSVIVSRLLAVTGLDRTIDVV